MDELVETIVRQADIEAEQARKIVKVVETYEREHSRPLTDVLAKTEYTQRPDRDGLESLYGRGFLG